MHAALAREALYKHAVRETVATLKLQLPGCTSNLRLRATCSSHSCLEIR